jgi:outer membrane protein OmpA-like peptidoglycan-associated protein
MLKHEKKYEEALENFLIFKKNYRKGRKDYPILSRLYKNEIEGCEMVLADADSSSSIVISNLGGDINYPHIEFSPMPLTDKRLIFGSLREKTVQYYDAEAFDTLELPKRKFYQAKKVDGSWSFLGELEHPANQLGLDVANGTYSLDSSRFYFSVCDKNWQYKTICKIYYVESIGHGRWSEPVMMGENINKPGFTSSHPTIGRESRFNQEVLYFVSDRTDKGRGGMDIWYSQYHPRKKEFKAAKNAGRSINTEGDEMTPYYDAKTRTLYFASDGCPNYGGFDIFKNVGEMKRWEERRGPINIGHSINSEFDELDYALKPSGNGGFFVSNRPGGQSLFNPTCCDDLYEFTDSEFIELIVNGKVVDEETKECVENLGELLIYSFNKEGEKYLSQTVRVKDCNFKIYVQPDKDYVFETDFEGHFNKQSEFSTKGIDYSKTFEKDLEIEKMPKKPVLLTNLTYEFDSPNLTKEAKNAIDTSLFVLMKNNPNIIVEISSHTDSKGSDSYNLRLSQRRAESVVNYLSNAGVSKERMKAKGFGESEPIAPNENEDGTDNPEGRAKNRRTEFTIIGELEDSHMYIEYEEDEED